MDLLTDLRTTNIALRREIQQQQQQIQGLQDAASVTPPTPITLTPNQLHPPATFGRNQNDCIETWLFQVGQYTTLAHVPDPVRASFAATFFCSSAAMWWRSFALALRTPLDCTWTTFTAACLQQFRPVNAAHVAREKLMSLTQTTSVATYTHRFRMLLLNIPDLSKADRLFLFVCGLKKEVTALVHLSNPLTWTSAAVTTENIDAVLWERHRLTTPWTPSPTRNTPDMEPSKKTPAPSSPPAPPRPDLPAH